MSNDTPKPADAGPSQAQRSAETIRDFDHVKRIVSDLLRQLDASLIDGSENVLKNVLALQKIQDQLLAADERVANHAGDDADDDAQTLAEIRAEIRRALDRIRETKAAAGLPEGNERG